MAVHVDGEDIEVLRKGTISKLLLPLGEVRGPVFLGVFIEGRDGVGLLPLVELVDTGLSWIHAE